MLPLIFCSQKKNYLKHEDTINIMEYIKYISLIGMLVWSLVHVLISPHFLQEKMFIHAAVIVTWGEILLILANQAAKGTWLKGKIVTFNTIYSMIFLSLAYLYHHKYLAYDTSFILFSVGIAKLFISVIYRDRLTTIILFFLAAITGIFQTYFLFHNQNILVPYKQLFPILSHPYIPFSLDIAIFLLAVFLAFQIVDEEILPSVLMLCLFLLFGIGLIGAGTWSAYVNMSWIISGLILGKGVVSISIPAFNKPKEK